MFTVSDNNSMSSVSSRYSGNCNNNVLTKKYLRILDIDFNGQFIRLINKSHGRSIDLSDLTLRQYPIQRASTPKSSVITQLTLPTIGGNSKTSATLPIIIEEEQQNLEDIEPINDLPTLNEYTFPSNSTAALQGGHVVTIWSNSFHTPQRDSHPWVYIAENVNKWETKEDMRTALETTKGKVIHEYVPCIHNELTDVPYLYKNSSRKFDNLSILPMLRENNKYKYEISPYCFTIDNSTHPYYLGRKKHRITPQTNPCYYNRQSSPNLYRSITNASYLKQSIITERKMHSTGQKDDGSSSDRKIEYYFNMFRPLKTDITLPYSNNSVYVGYRNKQTV
ncbi:unnamed protein product [Didymodactylos carnosus]|uniref:Uncharacterized protein n=1 Tax=Didymodactylos carnosus TaxID=1234261 RepID=A0A815QPH3_9BILA|nr:unnamed protein product [Didymodactylos carnosus]CAF1464859.1 unnamed protein product [Didymodactylos carnosus]CAF3636360.1 unnamed protein product [Didymodactylos carnosus]CAF4334286.1 unnamed protein product [Didymodactylos carnosus]